MANGTKTTSVIASCMILSWARDTWVKPIRFAGTWSRYSNSAMPQLASAAIHHGFDDRFLRWAYQAKVMNTFEATSRPADTTIGGSWIMRSSSRPGARIAEGDHAPLLFPEWRCPRRARAAAAAQRRARSFGDGER